MSPYSHSFISISFVMNRKVHTNSRLECDNGTKDFTDDGMRDALIIRQKYKTHPGFNFQIMSYTLYIVSFLRPSFVCFTHAHLYTEWQQVAEGRAQFIITGTEEDYVVVIWRYEFDRVTII